MTDEIHPLNALACVRAAQQVGLDVAGIDVVCHDITKPLIEQDGALIEVNAAPGIRMHQFPAKGQARDVGAAIVDALFPPGERTRIPVVAVTGTNGKTTTSLLVGEILRAAGYKTGVTTTEAIYIDGKPIKTGDCTGYWSARTLLDSPAVEAAVLETARGGIFKRGLAFDYCDVGVVLNVTDDHLGQHGAETLEDLARVKSLIARSAWNAAVLNAEDPLCVAMADQRHPGAQVIYFSLDPQCPALLRHLDAGGRGVYFSRQALVLADGDHRWPLVTVDALPFTLGGRARHNVANALAAVAAAWALGVPEAAIVEGLTRFGSTLTENPGRLNLFRVGEFRVLLDYAHNPASYRQILATARSLTQGRLIAVVAVPGDRYDDKLHEIGGIVADACDIVVVREKSDRRGRPPGEGPAVILRGVEAAGFAMAHAHLVLDPAQAIPTAFGLAAPGDLVLVACADHDLVVQMAELAEETLSPEAILAQLEAKRPA